jgi:hypothetical protein
LFRSLRSLLLNSDVPSCEEDEDISLISNCPGVTAVPAVGIWNAWNKLPKTPNTRYRVSRNIRWVFAKVNLTNRPIEAVIILRPTYWNSHHSKYHNNIK